ISAAARSDGAAALFTVVAGDLAGVASAPLQIDLPDTVVGLGPAVGLVDMATSFDVATRVVDTASAFGRTGTLRLEDLGLLPAVVAESVLGDELVTRYLAPLDSLG